MANERRGSLFKKLFSSESKQKNLKRSITIATEHPGDPGPSRTVNRTLSQPKDMASKPQKKSQPSSSKGKKKRGPRKDPISVDFSKPIEYPATPEMILEYHKKEPFLSKNEEWLLVEMNEYECLLENLDIIRIVAKHSKFFEVDPDQLIQEFFEFMEDVPSYDDVVNYDVWQEFRDAKYPV